MVVHRRGRVLLLRRPEGGRWAGLWDFPRFPVSHDATAGGRTLAALRRELVENVQRLTGAVVSPGEHIKTLSHGVTRFRITLDCYRAEYISSAGDTDSPLETRWVRPGELENYPLSSTGRRLARLVGDAPC